MSRQRLGASWPFLAALVLAALALYAYRDLFARPFAADDYQWLLNVRGLSFGAVLRTAFDPGAQSHFYRPLVWLLFWGQEQAFGLDPRGYHAVSLGLHALNAGLLGWLALRLQIGFSQYAIPLLAMAIVALHPAPFEAVVWVAAQSELLAAALLLLALHLWLASGGARSIARVAIATMVLALALLAKESAVIGLPLLALLGWGPGTEDEGRTASSRQLPTPNPQLLALVLPALVTLGYIGLQVSIERRNYLLAQGGYGIGPQLILNPLRSLALLVAPLPGSEHADAAWLLPVGALVALALLAGAIYAWRRQSTIYNLQSAMIVALGLTLLPTAPFVSPPDSRYLYLPVLMAALLVALTMDSRRWTSGNRSQSTYRLFSSVSRRGLVLCSLLFGLALAWWSAGELHAREGRFAAASGPGGSLWQLASAVCAEAHPDRVVIVEPPLAAPHAEAIIGLACGADVRSRIVGHDQVDQAIKGHSIEIDFPNGSAHVQRRT